MCLLILFHLSFHLCPCTFFLQLQYNILVGFFGTRPMKYAIDPPSLLKKSSDGLSLHLSLSLSLSLSLPYSLFNHNYFCYGELTMLLPPPPPPHTPSFFLRIHRINSTYVVDRSSSTSRTSMEFWSLYFKTIP